MESMESFPWMKSVYQTFSKTFPAEYNLKALKLLHKHLEEEYKQALNNDNDSLKKLYSCLRNLYNHFCWKINWNKFNNLFHGQSSIRNTLLETESQDMKICCLKILSYLIKTGIILSKGKPTSKWINHVLAAMRLFPGEFDLLCDALLLVQKLKTSCHKVFAAILKHFLYTNQIKTEEPAVYFKTLLLIRRLKILTPDKYEKSKLISFAIRIHCPRNAVPWLIAQGIHHLPKSDNKILAKKLLSKKVSVKFIKHLREVLLSGVENDTENIVVQNELFTIDSGIIIEDDPVSNTVKRTETKQMPKKRSSNKNSHLITDELTINDVECNNFLPKKKRKKSIEVLSHESPHEFNNSVLANITQNKESPDEMGNSFEDEGVTSHSRKKGRKLKSQRKSIRNVKDNNTESVHETLISTKKSKKLTNRKSESIEISSEENDKIINSNITICPEQLFVIDNIPSNDYEASTKKLSNNSLHNEGHSEKHSSSTKNSSEPHYLSMSADVTPLKGNQLLNVNDSSDEDSYEILKSSNNFLGDCFVDETELKTSYNTSKTENVHSEKEVSSLSANVSVPEDAILHSQTRCDSEIFEDSCSEKIGEEQQFLNSNETILNNDNHLSNSFPSSSNRTSQTEFQSATKTVLSYSDSLDSSKKCEENVTSDKDGLKENLASSGNKGFESVTVSSLSTSISVSEDDVILDSQTRSDTEITENSSLEKIGKEQQFSKPTILNYENHLNNSLSSSSSKAYQTEFQSATKTISSNSDSLDSARKCAESFISPSLKENSESCGSEALNSTDVSSLPTSVSVPKDESVLVNQTRWGIEITEDSSFEKIAEEHQFSKPIILNDENHLNNCFSFSSSKTLQTEPQSATKTILFNSDSLDSSKKCEENVTSDTDSLKRIFESEENKVLNSEQLNTSEKVSEDRLRKLFSDMPRAISSSHEKFEGTINMDSRLLHKVNVIKNVPLLYQNDLHKSLSSVEFCDGSDSTEVKSGMQESIMPSDISLLNDQSTDNVQNVIKNSTVVDTCSDENIDIIYKEDNELSCIEHQLNKSLHRSEMESKDNILNEQQSIHSKSSIIGDITENQPVHQLILDSSETTKNEEKVSLDVLDCYIKKVLDKMVDKVANKMDDVLEASSFEVLKEKMLKEGLTPLKFSPICKITNTVTNYDSESLKTESISPGKIKTCLSFSDISSENLETSEKLESDSSCMLNKLLDKRFCIYRDKLFELKDDTSDSVNSSLASIEQESEKNFQDNHSCTDSETESDDDIVHLKECTDILEEENDLSSSLPVSEKSFVVAENSDNQCIMSLDQNVMKSENSSVNNSKISYIEKQLCKLDQPLPQNVTTIKIFPPEEVELFTLSQPTVIVNLGKRCDSKGVINKMTAEEETNSVFEVKEDISSVFEETDNTSPKVITSQITNTEIESTHTDTEETIDEETLKGLFVCQNWDEDSCHSENNELEKWNKNQSQNALYSSQPNDCQIDLFNETTKTLPAADTVEKESSAKSPINIKEISVKLDSRETTDTVLSVNKSTASPTASEVLEKQPNIELSIELKEVSVQLDCREVSENILVPEISMNSSLFSSGSSCINLRKCQIDNCQTDLPTSEASAKESSIEFKDKSSIEFKEISIQLNPMEVSKIVSSIDNSNIIPTPSEVLEKESNFKVPIDPKEVAKNTLVSKISEESSGPSHMNLRKRQIGNYQSDLSVSEASAKESSDKPSFEIKEISIQLVPVEVPKRVSSINNSNMVPSPSEALENKSNFKTPIDPMEVTKNTVVSKSSEDSTGPSRMNLRKRQISNSQTDLSVSKAILSIPAAENLEKEQNVKSEDISVYLDSRETIKDTLVPNTSEKSDKLTNMKLRKHHSLQGDEKETLSRTPKSKKSMSLRMSKRLKSQTFNQTLSTDLSDLCLDSPTSKRSSRFKPLGELESVQKENYQKQSVETEELKNSLSEADTITTNDNSQESTSHSSYNLRNRKSIIMPGKLKL